MQQQENFFDWKHNLTFAICDSRKKARGRNVSRLEAATLLRELWSYIQLQHPTSVSQQFLLNFDVMESSSAGMMAKLLNGLSLCLLK